MTQWVDLEVEKEKRFSMYHRQFFAQILCLCYENPCKDRILFTVSFSFRQELKIELFIQEHSGKYLGGKRVFKVRVRKASWLLNLFSNKKKTQVDNRS